MNKVLSVLSLFLFNFTLALNESDLVEKRLAEVFPRDAITSLLDHRICIHFSGEEPYDEPRRQEIATNMKKHCHKFEEVLAKYEKKYSGKAWLKEFPKVWEGIGANSGDDFIWEVPSGESKLLRAHCESEAIIHLKKLKDISAEMQRLDRTRDLEKLKSKAQDLRESWDVVGKLLGRKKFISDTKYLQLEQIVQDQTISKFINNSY